MEADLENKDMRHREHGIQSWEQMNDAFEHRKGCHVDGDGSIRKSRNLSQWYRNSDGREIPHSFLTYRINVGDMPRKNTTGPSARKEWIMVDNVVL